jgi:hypothetical protein
MSIIDEQDDLVVVPIDRLREEQRLRDVQEGLPECIECGCTENACCPGGCSWVSMNPPLCSACVEAA